MAVTQCYRDWLDSLTQGDRDNLQDIIQQVFNENDQPKTDKQNLYDKITAELNRLSSLSTELQTELDKIAFITATLPVPGSCPQIDDALTDLLTDRILTIQAEKSSADGKIRTMTATMAALQSTIDDLTAQNVLATDLKFWV